MIKNICTGKTNFKVMKLKIKYEFKPKNIIIVLLKQPLDKSFITGKIFRNRHFEIIKPNHKEVSETFKVYKQSLVSYFLKGSGYC